MPCRLGAWGGLGKGWGRREAWETRWGRGEVWEAGWGCREAYGRSRKRGQGEACIVHAHRRPLGQTIPASAGCPAPYQAQPETQLAWITERVSA